MFEIGSSLREARERRGLTIADAEEQTKIRSRYLAALESERFDLLPGDAYAKGFLRGYAEFLGLDGDLYADEYGERYASRDEPIALPRSSSRHVPLAAVLDRRLLVVAGIVVAVAGLFWLGSGGNEEPSLAPAPPLARRRPPPPPPPESRSTRKPAPRAPATLRLVAADGDCWLSVQSVASGRVLYERTLPHGSGLRFGVRRPLRIRIGAPWNLRATLGGKRVDLPSVTGDVIASAAGVRTAPPA